MYGFLASSFSTWALDMTGIIGIISLLFLAWGVSKHRKAIDWSVVVSGLALQLLLALFLLKVPQGQALFYGLGQGIEHLLTFADQGAGFVFGAPVSKPEVMESLFGAGGGFIFAVKLISTLILVATLVSVGYYLKLLQTFVKGFAWAVNKILRVSGAEALSNSASVFVGQVEAQLLIKPYLEKMTRSELLASMAGSMACISGGTMAIYIGMGIPAHYLLTASLMAIPGALVISKLVFPETDQPLTQGNVQLEVPPKGVNLIDAASNGAQEGWHIGINVVVMLIAFISLIALIDALLGGLGSQLATWGLSLDWLGIDLAQLSMKGVLGALFYWVALAIGVPANEAGLAGGLMGTKLVINEFVAYADLLPLMKDGSLSSNTIAIVSFALCGFANIGSMAIQVGGIGAMAPSRKAELAQLGGWAILCGTMASYLSAAWAGVLLSLDWLNNGWAVGGLMLLCVGLIVLSNLKFKGKPSLAAAC